MRKDPQLSVGPHKDELDSKAYLWTFENAELKRKRRRICYHGWKMYLHAGADRVTFKSKGIEEHRGGGII